MKHHLGGISKKTVELFMTASGIFGSIATLPILIKMWFTDPEHAAGQSITTWAVFTAIAFIWVIYGVYHRLTPIWITNSLNFFIDLMIVIGIFRHTGITW